MVNPQVTKAAFFLAELLVATVAAVVILTVYFGLLVWSYFDEP